MILRPSSTEIPKVGDATHESGYGDIWYWWRNLAYMVRETFWIGVLVFIIVLAADAALFMTATRTYKSQASFVVNQSPFQFAQGPTDAEGSRLLLESIISSITSYDMRDIIAERLKVPSQNVSIEGLTAHGLSLKHPDQVNISVETERGSRTANIEAESSSPEFAAQAANAVMDEIEGLNRLGGKLNEVNQQIDSVQTEVNQFIQNLSSADAARVQLEQDVLSIDRHVKSGGSLETAPAFVQDQGLLDLQRKRIDADSAYSAQTQISVQGQQLRALEGSKDNVAQQIDSYLRNKEIGERSAAAGARARVEALKADLAVEQQSLNSLQREKTQLSDAVGDFKLRRQLGLFDNDQKAAEAAIILPLDHARASTIPAKPMLLTYLAAAASVSPPCSACSSCSCAITWIARSSIRSRSS